ncbi:MAG: putative Ig domain-containing protein [Proteobacteria bacterium]|nr:putative Ig domain-containing protein [Pseudomonadota bacterium]
MGHAECADGCAFRHAGGIRRRHHARHRDLGFRRRGLRFAARVSHRDQHCGAAAPTAADAPGQPRADDLGRAGRQRRGDSRLCVHADRRRSGWPGADFLDREQARLGLVQHHQRQVVGNTRRRRRAHLQQHRHHRFRRIAQRIAAGVLDHRQRGGESRASHLRRACRQRDGWLGLPFRPTASDPDGQTLTYSITSKPAWAAFSTTTGRLSGTPAAASAGTYSNIVITASDGALSASLPAFTITVNAAANSAPVISGTPATSIAAGSAYSFTPSATDANGDTLAFSITGKPAWATFSTATGALTGTPTAAQAGAYGGIVISVSDGTASQSLASFSIAVSAPPTGTGTATLSWAAPTQNTDGSSLTDLAGYRVYHGMNANSLTDMVQVPGAAAGSYTFTQLASGTHYFAVSAYTSSGAESSMSAVGSKTIP